MNTNLINFAWTGKKSRGWESSSATSWCVQTPLPEPAWWTDVSVVNLFVCTVDSLWLRISSDLIFKSLSMEDFVIIVLFSKLLLLPTKVGGALGLQAAVGWGLIIKCFLMIVTLIFLMEASHGQSKERTLLAVSSLFFPSTVRMYWLLTSVKKSCPEFLNLLLILSLILQS